MTVQNSKKLECVEKSNHLLFLALFLGTCVNISGSASEPLSSEAGSFSMLVSRILVELYQFILLISYECTFHFSHRPEVSGRSALHF